MGSPQGQRGLLILLGHRPEGGLRHTDDGGQDHDGQHQDGRQQAGAGGQVKGPLNTGDQQDHTHQAVHHGGDAGQQLHCGVDDSSHPGVGHLGQEHCGHQANGHPDENGTGCAIHRGKDKGQNAKRGVRGRGGPLLPKEEVYQTDLSNGRHPGDDQVDADKQHEGHRNDATQHKNQVHDPFQGILHPTPLGLPSL